MRTRLEDLYETLLAEGKIKSKKEFAEMLGIKPGNLSLYLSGEVKVSIDDKNFRLFEKAGISIKWLLTGEGEMFQQEAEGEPSAGRIPLLRQTVSCGPGQDWQDADNVESWIEPVGSIAEGRRLFGFRARGISMAGAGIQDGDILLFDGSPSQDASDDIYVFSLHGEAFCKLLRFNRIEGTVSIFSMQSEDIRKAELVRVVTREEESFRIFGRVIAWLHENRLMWR